MKIGIVILGCDKNTVDSEYLAGALAKRGALVTADPIGDGPVDAVVIATCGFTDEARSQTFATILEWAKYKRQSRRPMRLYVWSCMAQAFGEALLRAIPELDGAAGVGRFDQLAEAILSNSDGLPATDFNHAPPSRRETLSASAANWGAAAYPQSKIQNPILKVSLASPAPLVKVLPHHGRLRLDRRPYAFLKIADGCNHRCTFCSIPMMKGPLRSVSRRILLDEARALLDSGVREINLIAQDVTAYGLDMYSHYRLPDLLEDLLALEGDFWIRLLYVYPGGLSRRLIELLAQHPKLCPYLDLPVQHLDPRVLRAMERPQPNLDIERLVERLRENIPDLALRTTMMVGFPSEDRRAFDRLIAGVERIQFDRLGTFVFSPEPGTPAAAMSGRPRRQTALERMDRLMRLQAAISAKKLRAWIGRTVRVLIESPSPEKSGNSEKIRYLGRTMRDAPEVDGVVKVRSSRRLSIGSFVDVRITEAETYDLVGVAGDKTAAP